MVNTSAESPEAAKAKKEWLEARARDKKAREEAKAAAAEAAKPKPPREIDYVLVRHMARSPRTRTMRAARAGHRRQGILLSDGTRIRKKGRQRLTELPMKAFVENHAQILEFIEVGALELVNPKTLNPMSIDEAKALVKAPSVPVPQSAPAKPTPPPEDKPQPQRNGKPATFEEELRRMNRGDLNKIASRKYGVAGPEGFPNKQAVIDAILAAGGGE